MFSSWRTSTTVHLSTWRDSNRPTLPYHGGLGVRTGFQGPQSRADSVLFQPPRTRDACPVGALAADQLALNQGRYAIPVWPGQSRGGDLAARPRADHHRLVTLTDPERVSGLLL